MLTVLVKPFEMQLDSPAVTRSVPVGFAIVIASHLC